MACWQARRGARRWGGRWRGGFRRGAWRITATGTPPRSPRGAWAPAAPRRRGGGAGGGGERGRPPVGRGAGGGRRGDGPGGDGDVRRSAVARDRPDSPDRRFRSGGAVSPAGPNARGSLPGRLLPGAPGAVPVDLRGPVRRERAGAASRSGEGGGAAGGGVRGEPSGDARLTVLWLQPLDAVHLLPAGARCSGRSYQPAHRRVER